MQNAECRMKNAKCRMKNAKCRMQNEELIYSEYIKKAEELMLFRFLF